MGKRLWPSWWRDELDELDDRAVDYSLMPAPWIDADEPRIDSQWDERDERDWA